MSIGILPTAMPASAAPISVVADDELYEVIEGQRVRTPPMAIISVWIASRLARLLGNFADGTLGRVIVEGLFHLPTPINRDRRPDVAFVSYVRWPKTKPMPPTDDAWDVVPNLATEVVSPNDKVDELEKKIEEYFLAGVELVWVVHSTMRKTHVYSPPKQIDVRNIGDVLDGGTVVPGFKLPLAVLFADE